MSFKNRLPKTIIKKAQKGDRFALTRIYHEYKSAIFGLAYRITRDSYASEDILQQVIERVLVKIHTLNEPEKFNGWLKTLSYRAAIDYITQKSLSVSSELDEEAVSDSVTLDTLDIDKYLQILNSRERLVIMLFLVEGYKHKEIAENLKITEANSKQIYRRSLNKLRVLSEKGAYSGKKVDLS